MILNILKKMLPILSRTHTLQVCMGILSVQLHIYQKTCRRRGRRRRSRRRREKKEEKEKEEKKRIKEDVDENDADSYDKAVSKAYQQRREGGQAKVSENKNCIIDSDL